MVGIELPGRHTEGAARERDEEDTPAPSPLTDRRSTTDAIMDRTWLPRKIQQPPNGRVGTCSFADLARPLPDPPRGQTWVRDEATREWTLVPVAVVPSDDVAKGGAEGGAVEGDAARFAAVAVPVAESAPEVRYHRVEPTDTFQGLCLRYKVTPTELRRANRLLGSNLKFAPEYPTLVIPSNRGNAEQRIKKPTQDEQIASFLSKLSYHARERIAASEARAYLELADGDVALAAKHANGDFSS